MAQYETSLATLELRATRDSPESVIDDRRRLGSSDHDNPTSIPPLRTTSAPGLPPEDNADLARDYEELTPEDAIAAIVLLSLLLLGVIGLVGWTIVY